MNARLVVFAAVTASLWGTYLPAEAKLIMFEDDGCVWCELWRKEVGKIYHKTPEGRQAELVVLDIFDDVPEQFDLISDAHYTPTFVLVDNGKEIGRIEGYPGEGFFWGLLGKMLEKIEDKAS